MTDTETKNALLDFLNDGIFGHERDAVTRAFYEYAQGDPHSYPVGMSVLLTACTRKMASLPQNLRDASTDFHGLLQELMNLQRDLLAKLSESHEQVLASFRQESDRVITAFKDGNANATDIWRQTVKDFFGLLDHAKEIRKELNPVLNAAKQIAQDSQTLQSELNLHDASAQKIISGVETLKVFHEEAKVLHRQNESLVYDLINDARANWLTVGFLAGILLAAAFPYMYWWLALLCTIIAVVVLQFAFRGDKRPPEKMTPTPEPKSLLDHIREAQAKQVDQSASTAASTHGAFQRKLP